MPEDSARIGALLSGQRGRDHRGGLSPLCTLDARSEQFRCVPAQEPLVADGRVRQVLFHATDTEKIVETIFSVNSPQATLILARTATGCADHSEKRKFDPELAAKLPEEAGGP